MELCWSKDPKLRPSFLEIIRMLEDDVSEDFLATSFYHEMKKKALEDTLYGDGNLYEMLSRPASSTPKRNIAKIIRHDSSLSDDSGAFIENCKSEVDQRSPSSVMPNKMVTATPPVSFNTSQSTLLLR
jgi:hypothetical protein